MNKIVGLKEFRENVSEIVSEVKKGRSFTVVKRSKPIFKVSPLDVEEEWETVVDFTEFNKEGIPARQLLNYLRNGQNPKSSKKTKS
jgi:prevent-host-death family protein